MSATTPLPIKPLLLVGVVVPAIFAAIDHWLLKLVDQNSSSPSEVAVFMAVLVLQIGLMGWLCGRFLESPWRWCCYAWCWLLIDLQLFSATASISSQNGGDMLPGALYAAQIGLFLVWGILGSSSWAARWPLCAMAIVIVLITWRWLNGWRWEIVLVQTLSLAALCVLLRCLRFRLELVRDDQVKERTSRRIQFNIGHVLLWMLSIGAIITALRVGELLSLEALQLRLYWPITFLVTAGLLMAVAYIVVLWSALGSGQRWIRLLLPLLIIPIVGAAAMLSKWDSERLRYIPFAAFQGWGWEEIWHHYHWLMYWAVLGGVLLYASLIILRVIGLRLVRTTRKTSHVPVG